MLFCIYILCIGKTKTRQAEARDHQTQFPHLTLLQHLWACGISVNISTGNSASALTESHEERDQKEERDCTRNYQVICLSEGSALMSRDYSTISSNINTHYANITLTPVLTPITQEEKSQNRANKNSIPTIPSLTHFHACHNSGW